MIYNGHVTEGWREVGVVENVNSCLSADDIRTKEARKKQRKFTTDLANQFLDVLKRELLKVVPIDHWGWIRFLQGELK